MDEDWVRWILSGLVAVIMSAFGAMIRRLFTRQDALERDKANRESVDKRFEALIDELREQRSEFREHEAEDRSNFKDVLHEIREQTHQLSQTNGILQNLVGRVDATLKAANFGSTNGQR